MFENEICLIDRKLKADPLFAAHWFYPNSYAIGMSSLGYQLVWKLLEDDPETVIYRGFADIAQGFVNDSELIGFTLSWELDYINVLKILEAHRIPLLAKERTDDHPIIFAGGPVLSANPEPFAEFFDAILLGDAESVVPSFINSWKSARKQMSREERLHQMCKVPGVYVPCLYNVSYGTDAAITSIVPCISDIPAQITKQLYTPPPDYVAHSVLLNRDTTWGDMFLVEIMRSCPQECRFCLASFLTRPVRPGGVDALLSKIDLGLKYTKKIGLLGPSVTEHPRFEDIACALRQRPETELSIASVRADSLTETILSTLRALGQKSITIAIESGSERLRTIIKKNLTETEIWQAVNLISEAGFKSLKLYCIVGLPHETWEDLDETVRLISQIKKSHKQLKIALTLSSFVPKAQTPFQWVGRDKNAKDKLEYVRAKLAKQGVDVRPESHNWSDIQAVLSRGDRRLMPVLLDVHRQGGTLGAWKRAFRNKPDSVPGMDYFAFRTIAKEEMLPWHHICDPAKTTYLAQHDLTAALAAHD